MINLNTIIKNSNKKVGAYNKNHKKKWKGHVIENNTLWIFWNSKKVEYIPFFCLKNTMAISEEKIRKIAKIK